MRLICPNCAAQYEVDASMIPPEGRDVQCSSCGHTWFQNPDEAEEMLADELGVTEHAASFDPVEPETDPEPEPIPVPLRQMPAADAPKSRPLDDAAREILRQEAARESAARRREGGAGLESQPDLGLEDPGGAQSRAAAAKARLARLRQTPEEVTEEQAVQAAADIEAARDTVKAGVAVNGGSRRGLLPDIEEINSTLTATGERSSAVATEDDVQDEKSRRGFRFGFVTVMAAVVVLMLLYLFAPQISAAVPAASSALAGYLDWANGMLDGLDALLRRAVDAMSGLVGTEG